MFHGCNACPVSQGTMSGRKCISFGNAVALTGLTAAATYIEAEPTGFVPRPSFCVPAKSARG